ncbi:MAG: metal-dependent transcriptional regulator [Opitutaceae bacterium]|jgi:DtxR family Mn-dependent transcriptional regulator
MPTSTAENYLKAILARSAGADGVVATGAIAKALGVTSGTITTMVKSLAAQGLLEYHSREGVRLTPEGRKAALVVVRKHRLVETFLVQVLEMDWAEVDQEAESLEHSISERVLSLIDDYLGHPAVDPHGDLIPRLNSPQFERSRGQTLATCAVGKPLRVEHILDQSPGFLTFIQDNGLKPGTRVRLRKRDKVGGVVECELSDRVCVLGLAAAGKVEVKVGS